MHYNSVINVVIGLYRALYEMVVIENLLIEA
jgi:hypothetical protein